MNGSGRDQGYVMRNGQAIPVETAFQRSPMERQADALERIADTLDRMLAVMLADEEDADPVATLDQPAPDDDDSPPWDEDTRPQFL